MCYLPGTLLLGIRNGLPKRLLPLATNLMYTCYKMYESMPTGLSPEIVHFDIADQASEDIIVKVSLYTLIEFCVSLVNHAAFRSSQSSQTRNN